MSMASRVPLQIVDRFPVIGGAGEYKQEVGKAIEVDGDALPDVLVSGEPDDDPFSATADRPGEMKPGSER